MWILSLKQWRVGYLEKGDDVVDNEVPQGYSVEKLRV